MRRRSVPRQPGVANSLRTEVASIMRQSTGEGRSSFHGSFEHVHDDLPPEDRHPIGADQLVQQMRETADKLIRDGATRGDVKLLNTALKELRYCFKVFTPYRHLRKVTVFGSARLPSTNPAYQQAV